MSTTTPNYDPVAAAYILKGFFSLQANDPKALYQAIGLDTGGLETHGKLFDYALSASGAVFDVVDFSEGFDGPFAYEALDDHRPGSMIHSLYSSLLDGTENPRLVIAQYAEQQGWDLTPLGREILDAAADLVPAGPEL